MNFTLAASVCFVASHPGSMDHFPALASALQSRGVETCIYARGTALDKSRVKGISAIPFTEFSEIVKKCERAQAVITELCDPAMAELHEQLVSPVKYAYYDNSQAVVSKEYETGAKKVIEAAGRVIYANANLSCTQEGIESTSLGFYPMDRVEEFIALRKERAQDALVLFGAATQEYREEFPKLLEMLQAVKNVLPDHQIFIQKHPRSSIETEIELPEGVILSEHSYEESVARSAFALYFQTGDAAKFALAGIPTIHVASRANQEDLLVANQACYCATSSDELVQGIAGSASSINREAIERVLQALGSRGNWPETLYNRIQIDIEAHM